MGLVHHLVQLDLVGFLEAAKSMNPVASSIKEGVSLVLVADMIIDVHIVTNLDIMSCHAIS